MVLFTLRTFFNASVDYQALAYGSYDPAGRILEIDDLRGSGVGDAYDPLGRLTYAEGPDGSETNAYDESTSRVVRYSPEEMSVRHYLAGGMVEVDQSELRRYFFLGSRRVAMNTVTLPSSPDNPIWTDAPGILATAFAGRGPHPGRADGSQHSSRVISPPGRVVRCFGILLRYHHE